jgi:hypothetical protein
MGASELADGAKKAVTEVVTEQAPSLIGGLLSGAWNLIKSVLPYVLVIPAVLIADEKLNEGKGLKFIKGLFGGKEADKGEHQNKDTHDAAPTAGSAQRTVDPKRKEAENDVQSLFKKPEGVHSAPPANGASTPPPPPPTPSAPKDAKAAASAPATGK